MPLAFFSFNLAAAVYMEVLLVGLLLALALYLMSIRWLPSPLILGWLVLWTLLAYFSIRGMLLAQPGLLVYVFHIAALWAIVKRQDTLAGVMLALATIKPQNSILLVPLLLLWALSQRRWRIIGSFGVVWGTLFILSFILEPSWFSDWLDRVNGYAGYAETYPAARLVAEMLPASQMVYLVLSGLLIGAMLFYWYRLLVQKQDDLLWVYLLTITVTLMISPRTATTSYVELYPILYSVAFVWRSHPIRVWTAGMILLIGYYILHIQTIPSETSGSGSEADIVYLVFPILLLGLLWWYRQEWPVLQTKKDT
jgi:hypothetical protein